MQSRPFRIFHIRKTLTSTRNRHGFALVVTVSLMVLLTVIAVGILGLSALTLRGASLGEAEATARANARMALILALGELQHHAGPDQRVTARADLLDEQSPNPLLTGVWDSWHIETGPPPAPDDFERSAKNAGFRRWLVSAADPAAPVQTDFANRPTTRPVTLWDTNPHEANPAARLSAGKVPVTTGRGSYAWAVIDEGLKARINTPFNPEAASVGAKTAQLGSGQRPAVEFIDGLGGLERPFFREGTDEFALIEKGFSRTGFELAVDQLAPDAGERLRALAHDLTTDSIGLFTDTARGGLREDMHLLARAATLPDRYRSRGVYASRLDLPASTTVSDPRWESFHQFANLYRQQVLDADGVPAVRATWPRGWQAASGSPPHLSVNRRPPPGVVLMPTIAKVQVLFSLIGRDLYDYPPPAGNTIPTNAPVFHNPQGGHFRGTKYQYDLHLMYAPVVTLHNPYNVALDFYRMRVEFVHTPFAMQVFRNGVPQSSGLVPVDTMYVDNESGSKEKTFGINLRGKSSSGRPGSTTIRLLPGETKTFSPYIDPERTYRDEFRGSRQAWDIYVDSHITKQISAIPGWRGDGIGYSCDWLAGGQRIDGNKENGRWAACLGLARDDRIHVEFAPLSVPQYSRNKFVVRVTAATTPSGQPVTAQVIEIDYERPSGLQDFILGGRNATLRFPKEGTVRGIDLVDHATVPISELRSLRPFALLSVQAKTTSGGRDESNEDGRLATMPWCFGHGPAASSTQRLLSEHPSHHSHEIDLQRLDNGTASLIQIDPMDRGNFISGHTPFNGVKFGALYDIPLHPIQTLSALNGANPGGMSGYLPRFARPIGNSWAHPLLPGSAISMPQPDGAHLDHSFLLNTALYDGFYFSGLADQDGHFGSGRTSAELAASFAAGDPLDDPRLVLHRPDRRPVSELSNMIEAADAHTRIAAWQMMRGAFNINSTSVAAWKAMLASTHDARALVNQLDKAAGVSTLRPLGAAPDDVARVSRFRLPASRPADAIADPRDAYWLGPRELSDAELQRLAEEIVRQVRLRGPFLSLAEFVNRRLGSGELALRGALQHAIDEADLNQRAAVNANAGFEIPAAAVEDYKYANPEAGTGSSYRGAPGFLSQSDLLDILGNAATARSDTFTIRAYGEASDPAGRVLARAICEAVVQRVPEWLDPADPVERHPDELDREENRKFGRRIEIIAFRWLHPREL